MKRPSEMQWLNLEQKISRVKTNGKGIVELTAYQGIALWWFIRFRLYHAEDANLLARLLMRSSSLFLFADFFYDLFTAILCRLVSACVGAETEKKNPNVLMVSHDYQWRQVHYPSGVSRKFDVFLAPIIEELGKRDYNVTTLSQLKYSMSAVKIMIEKLKAEGVTHRAFNSYWSPRIWTKQLSATNYFRDLWKSLSKSDKRFVARLKRHVLTREMPHYFNAIFGHIVKVIEMAKEVVRKEEPSLILVTSEASGIFEKALIVAGKLKGVPTLAVQHGHIGPLHQGYMYSKNSIDALGSVRSPYAPIADRTAVYGPFFYDLLTKISAYPASAIAVTGQPRYDRMAIADEVFNKEEFCAKWALSPRKKIVLVATQPLGMREPFITQVLRALRLFPEAQTVIKPHPRENTRLYERLIRKEKRRIVLLPKRSDTLKALHACDVLIAMSSTVITEATILGRVAVTVRSSHKDPASYYQGVTLRVDLAKDLAPIIRQALYNDKTKEKLKRKEKDFAFAHTYKQNGMATQRVVDLIEELMRTHNG